MHSTIAMHELSIHSGVLYMTPSELHILRKQFGLTQADLAERLGVSRLTVSNWERARFTIPRDLEQQMAKANLTAAPAKTGKPSRLTLDTIKYYGEMRRDGNSHASIMKLWNEKNFVPTVEAQAGIAADWPDILNHGETK